MRTKYPRTLHLPWSPGRTTDDLVLEEGWPNLPCFFGGQEVVVTEKMDGENTTLYRDAVHARSLDSRSHPSRDWMKGFQAQIGSDIPVGMRICGENLFAQHSILYTSLPSYFLVFGVYQEPRPFSFEKDRCLSWDDTVEWCSLLGLQTVPVLYRGLWDEKAIRACFTGVSRFGAEQEGYVVRVTAAFSFREFGGKVAKFVRQNHVQTDEHWMHRSIQQNGLQPAPTEY